MRLCLPRLVPLVLGGLEGALGEWPVRTWPVVGAPSAAPAAARSRDVGGGGTDSSSSAATGKGSVDDAGTVAAADGSAVASTSSFAVSSVLP